MSRSIRVTPFRTALAVLVLALCGVAMSAGGAVAAHLITSRDIKDGTIQERDVSFDALAAFRGLNGYQVDIRSVDLPAGTSGNVELGCPGDSRVLDVSGFWDHSDRAVQAIIESDGSGGIAFGHTLKSAPDTLNIRIACARVNPLPN